MRKWLLLLVLLVGWIAIGLMLFDGDSAIVESGGKAGIKAERIVSISPNITETLFALGLGDRIVGVSEYSDYPPEAKNKPAIGSFFQPNIEAIINLEPDLVLTLGFVQQKEIASRLSKEGYNTLSVDIETIDEFYAATESIGVATGCNTKAKELIGRIKENIKKLSTKLAGLDRPKVLWVIQQEPLRVAGTETFVNEMIEMAGGVNAMDPTVHQYPPIGSEQVIACGADVIIQPAMIIANIETERANAIKLWQRFENVPAVKNGRIYVIEGDIVSQLGPRLYNGVEMIAKYLQPEVFED